MKKKIILIISIAVVVLIVVLGICYLKMNQGLSVSSEDMMIAIKNEYKTIIEYDEGNNNPVLQTIYEGFDVEIISIDEEELTAECKISNYDVCAAFDSLDTESEMTVNEYVQLLADKIVEQERLSEEVYIAFTINEDNSCQVSFTEEQLDLAMGGFLSYYVQLMGEVE